MFELTGCDEQEKEPAVDFIEVRIHKSTALRGGEIFLLRKIGDKWSAKLMGDAERLSCSYDKDVTPKSEWGALYNSLLNAGLKELSGKESLLDINDGDSYVVETTAAGSVSRYVVHDANYQQSENAKRIIRIGQIISREFDTPVFSSTETDLGDYLIKNCRDMNINRSVR